MSPRSVQMNHAFLLNKQVFMHFYEGRPANEETRRLAASQRGVMRSTIGRIRGLYATASALYAGLLLVQRASPTSNRARIDRELLRLEGWLVAERTDYTLGFAGTIVAAREHQLGRNGAARCRLEEAKGAFERAGMLPARAASLVRIGQIEGGAAGRRTIQDAFAELESLGIRRPDRYVRVHTPGFDFEGAPARCSS